MMSPKSSATVCALSNMNEHGIRCMTSGKHSEASKAFQHTLRQIREQIMTGAEAGTDQDVTIIHPIATERCQNLESSARLTADASFEICDIAFGVRLNSLTGANLAWAAAAVLYNLALNDHLAFLSTANSALLKRSARFYKKSLQVIQSQESQEQDYGKCLFLLSLCNNLGHCHSTLCEEDGKQTCQSHLANILAHPDCADLLRPQDFEFFHLNSLVAHSQIKTAAAA